jgi:hypothetical protein
MICVYFAAEMSLKRNGAATSDGKVDLFEYLTSNNLS